MMVAEWGTGEDPDVPGRKAQWFLDSLPQFQAMPYIKAIAYYDQTKSELCPRWLDTSQSSLDAFTAIGADPYFNPFPILDIASGPSDPTTETTATFVFSAERSGATTLCSLDSARATVCTSPISYLGLDVGTHTFAVKGIDAEGDVGNPTRWTWTITT
jgi:hypothetical protein